MTENTNNTSTVFASVDAIGDPGVAALFGMLEDAASTWSSVNAANETKGQSAEDIAVVLAKGTPEADAANAEAERIIEQGNVKAAKVKADAKEKANAAKASVLSAFMEKATEMAANAGAPDMDAEKKAKAEHTDILKVLRSTLAKKGINEADVIGLMPDVPSKSARVSFGSQARSYDPAVVREWAVENGVEVSPRGRISGDVLDAYNLSNA